MQIIAKYDVIDAGGASSSELWKRAVEDVETAIARIDWPWGSGKFKLNPNPREREDGTFEVKNPNGVVPIKKPALEYLNSRGWKSEGKPRFPEHVLLTPRDVDAMLTLPDGCAGFEWETGNVSSSHRAISKLLDALHYEALVAGFLAVPMGATQRHLTDRIGKFEEISNYFEHWSRYPIQRGVLRVYGIQHDELDPDVEHIPKGSDGRSKKRRRPKG